MSFIQPISGVGAWSLLQSPRFDSRSLQRIRYEAPHLRQRASGQAAFQDEDPGRRCRPTEESRIEALSSAGNRDLLEIVATKQPRSISSWPKMAGRASTEREPFAEFARPCWAAHGDCRWACVHSDLTQEGQRKAQELGFVAQAPTPSLSSPTVQQESVLSVTIVGSVDGDLATDAVQAKAVMRCSTSEGQLPVTAHAQLDLNDICTNLLTNWWRVLYRRGDPFKMFPIEKETNRLNSQAIVLAASTGHMELFVRSTVEDRELWSCHVYPWVENFAAMVLENFADRWCLFCARADVLIARLSRYCGARRRFCIIPPTLLSGGVRAHSGCHTKV